MPESQKRDVTNFGGLELSQKRRKTVPSETLGASTSRSSLTTNRMANPEEPMEDF